MTKPYDRPRPEDIDEAIRPLVNVLNGRDDFCTWGSCEGHPGHEFHAHTYIGVAVKGLAALQLLVETLNAVRDDFESADDELLIECALNWSWDVGGSTDLKSLPDWVSFEIQFESIDGDAIGSERLKRVAAVFEKHFA